jgi:hypothetical protein
VPDIDLSSYANTPQADLESRRREIVALAAGRHDNLPVELLHELAAITGVLRRKASGPPKAAKAPKAAKPVKPAAATLDDLA